MEKEFAAKEDLCPDSSDERSRISAKMWINRRSRWMSQAEVE
jgi:hypothetical protein